MRHSGLTSAPTPSTLPIPPAFSDLDPAAPAFAAGPGFHLGRPGPGFGHAGPFTELPDDVREQEMGAPFPPAGPAGHMFPQHPVLHQQPQQHLPLPGGQGVQGPYLPGLANLSTYRAVHYDKDAGAWQLVAWDGMRFQVGAAAAGCSSAAA
jgi:hypothetical protein